MILPETWWEALILVVLAVFPLLILAALIYLIATGSSQAKKAIGHCESCGYDLFGLHGDKCPECGHPIDLSDQPFVPFFEGNQASAPAEPSAPAQGVGPPSPP
jgi:hypothetical protein